MRRCEPGEAAADDRIRFGVAGGSSAATDFLFE
jgi:hypothetical protein